MMNNKGCTIRWRDGCFVSNIVILVVLSLSGGCKDSSDSSPTNDEMTVTDGVDRRVSTAGEEIDSDHQNTEVVAGSMVPEGTAGIDIMGGSMRASDQLAGDFTAGEMNSGSENRPVSCLISCAEFVECAIKQCPGYDEPDDTLLMEECIDLCTPAIAELFNRVAGCAEKLRFASTVRTDFMDFCDSETDGFCETYVATCGTWVGNDSCVDHYNLAPREGTVPNRGAHQLCYEYHLGSAMVALEEGHTEEVTLGCERAAGLSMCTDE